MNYLKDYNVHQINHVKKYLEGKKFVGATLSDRYLDYVFEDGSIISKDIYLQKENHVKEWIDKMREYTGGRVKDVIFSEERCDIILDNGLLIHGELDIDFILTEY